MYCIYPAGISSACRLMVYSIITHLIKFGPFVELLGVAGLWVLSPGTCKAAAPKFGTDGYLQPCFRLVYHSFLQAWIHSPRTTQPY
jgi:hypothetical protein